MMASNRPSVKQRLEQGENYKAEGNESFRQKEYRKAIKKYHFALLQVKDLAMKMSPLGLVPDDGTCNQSEKERGVEISRGCYNNLAACFVKTESWDKVVEYTTKVLDSEPQNVKALFRRGQARYHLKDYDRAQDDLMVAQQLEPSDSAIQKHLNACKRALRDFREKEKGMYASMFTSTPHSTDLAEDWSVTDQ